MLVRIVYFLIPAVIIVSTVFVAVRIVANRMNAKLKQENLELRQEIGDLRQAEPEKLRALRDEVEAYSRLTDKILTHIARRRNALDIAPIEEQITNIIEANRPNRSTY